MKKTIFKIALIGILALCMCGCGSSETTKETKSNKTKNTSYKEYEKVIDEYELKHSGDVCKYELIYFNNDDIPELVTGVPGKFVGLYSLNEEGKLNNIIEDWTYGSFGNKGYEYAEKKGIIRNLNTDYAGLVLMTTYIKVNENYSKELYLATVLQEEAMNSEIEATQKTQAKEYIDEYGGYFHNNARMTKEEFENSIGEDKYDLLEGAMSATEIKEELLDLRR